MGVKKVIFLPDDYLAKYVASQTDVEIIAWKGICIVHDQFNEKEINEIRNNNPGIKIIAHPECPPDVIKATSAEATRLSPGGQQSSEVSR